MCHVSDVKVPYPRGKGLFYCPGQIFTKEAFLFKTKGALSWALTALVIALVALGGVTACIGNNTPNGGEAREVVDDLGRHVWIPAQPERIVSLAPSNTEILFALGVGDKVVGVTEYCDYPPEVIGKERVGGYDDIDVEKVLELEPDLVLAEDIHTTNVVPSLEQLNIPVVVIVPHNLEEIISSVEFIGDITASQSKASEIAADMQQRIQAVTATLSDSDDRPSVLYVLWWGEGGIMSAGSNTPIDELIHLAGGVSISHNDSHGNPTIGWPTLNLEDVISADPEVIIVDLGDGGTSLHNIGTEPRLSGVSAVANGRIYGIDPDLTSRPTPRIVDGLEAFAGFIHPELFPEFYSQYTGERD